ncbi:MAG TPA: extracellular solute-binding protein [Stellaceae bacterium]|nr:extracellular solute-binding protein [Stellaceae bacterium]
MSTKLLSRAALLAVFLALAATGASAQSPEVGGESVGTTDLVKAACAEGGITYYTAQSDADEREIVKPFEAQFSCIKVSVISAVTGRLYERIRTEAQAGKPLGDVALITDEALAQQLMDGKLVRAWNPPVGEKYPANSKIEGWWYAASGSLMYAIYNTDLVKPAEAPKTWADLLDPKWKGKIATSPITIGGTAWMLYDFMQVKLGGDYLKKFVAQEPKLFSAYNAVVLAAARGEVAIAVTSALNDYPIRVGQGAPLAPVYPPEGLPFTNYPMLLLANSPHPHAAELFANWYLTRVAQAELVRVRGAYSVRADVAPAKGNPPLAETHPWNPGHDTILKQHDALVTTVTQAFGNR